ncbi:MAG TPA: hypothetical protein VGL61_32390 [Kofleriaceae bacterium]
MRSRHARLSVVALLVAAPFRQLGLGLAPAREVALDQLAVGAGAREPAAGEVDGAEPLVVRDLCTQLGVTRVGELAAAACDKPLGQRERLRAGLRPYQLRTCGVEYAACELRALARGGQPVLGFARITDGTREISAA